MEEKRISIQVKRTSGCEDLPLPSYISRRASGMDLYAAIEGEMAILPGEIKLIPTGLRIALPQGYEAQIRPRSGLALQHGIGLLNSPGTIDADYRGEIGVLLINQGKEPFWVKRGDRIAQMVICPILKVELIEVEELEETERNEGGFGHTGR